MIERNNQPKINQIVGKCEKIFGKICEKMCRKSELEKCKKMCEQMDGKNVWKKNIKPI